MSQLAEFIERFLGSPILWGIVALVAIAIALSGRLSVNAAVILVWVAYGAAIFGIFRAGILRNDPTLRYLVVGALATVIAIGPVLLQRWFSGVPPFGVGAISPTAATSSQSAAPSKPSKVITKGVITKRDGSTILIPIDTANQNMPIPLDENPDDPHRKFYRTLTFSITNRHPAETSGNLMLQEEQLFSEEGRPKFLGKLIQMYVFDSLFHMARESYGIELSGGRVTPIEDKAVIPPDVVSSPTDNVIADLSKRRLLTQNVELSLRNFPLHMPKGTNLSFNEQIEREAALYTIRMERPGFFKFDLTVRPIGNSQDGVLPDGFQTQVAKTVKTYNLIVAMESVVQVTEEDGFDPDKYVTWTQDTFSELRRRMTF